MGDKNLPDVRLQGFIELWKRQKLGEVIEISSASRVHKNEWVTEGIRFFRSSDVVSKFVGKENVPAFISSSLYNELSKKSGSVQLGDVLVTGGGSIGIPYLVADDEPLYFKDADLIWLKSAQIIDGYFLYSYFITPKLRKYISSITHIGTISHYTIEQAKDTPIALPDRIEQSMIGVFFREIDFFISIHKQELTTLKQTKQGFLQKMFPKEGESVPEVRFQGFSGEWNDYKFRDLVIRNTTQSIADLPRIEFEDIISGEGRLNKDITGKIDNRKGIHFQPNSILFGKLRPYLKNWLLPSFEGIALGDFWVFEAKDSSSLFLFYLIQSKKFQMVANLSTGTKMPRSDWKIVSETDFKVPKIEEQVLIGKFFDQLDQTIALQVKELEALQQTKKAFLQKMFV